MDGLLAGGVIGLPPILNYGSAELYEQIIPDVCYAGIIPALATLIDID